MALVTGAANGLGAAITLRLASEGYQLVATDIESTDEIVARVQSFGRSCYGAHCDVSSGENVKRLGELVLGRSGRCDIVVANAGIYPVAPFLETSFETWRKIMSVNVDSLFHLTQTFLPRMQELQWGRFIIAATNGFYTGIPQLTPYVASKGAVVGFVRSLAGEIGDDGVTINAYAPTLTRTRGTRDGKQEEVGLFELTKTLQAISRNGEPEDITGLVAFLASDDARFITGQTILVDGGLARS